MSADQRPPYKSRGVRFLPPGPELEYERARQADQLARPYLYPPRRRQAVTEEAPMT